MSNKIRKFNLDQIKVEAIHRLMYSQGLSYWQARKRVLEQFTKEGIYRKTPQNHSPLGRRYKA